MDTVGIQEIGEPVPSGLGQALFSPDGTKHIRYNGISDQEGEYTTIYDFDRCTGELSNFRQFNYPQGGPAGGAAFSKNSRYLYTTSSIYIYQYDLWADDIEASRTLIAEYDGYLNFLPTTFYQAQLGPDGKIYICASNGVRSLHVIHNPDAACPACGVEQHGIALPTYNAFSIPNQPNYRLGPIDGSPCDTLGIDNIPLARWRYSQDTLAPLQVQFTDLSDYEPAAWSWDFGDGAASAEANPLHPFEAPGAYEVCLTASNANGSSTQCKELVFSPPAGSDEPSLNGEAVLFPNPFDAHLSLSLPPGWLPVHASLRLFNQLGQPAGQWRLHAGVNTFEVRHLPGGVYFYVLEEGGKVWQQGKVVRR
ncbi:MAG: PKD domain-containing protein [Lewinellaceae bacterium]|nr:PKD domain-containing protein [Lewinellaceae bacterium]